jgi:uncharacterized membrane protein
MCMIVLLWASAMGIDVGFSVWGSRQAQAMADTTALDLARYINLADNNTSVTGVQNYLNLKLANVDTDNASRPTGAHSCRRQTRWNRRATRYRSLPGSPCPRSSTGDSGS